MLTLDDTRWLGLTGAYRRAYDPRHALRRLAEEGDKGDVWAELWNELHHQGDVGDCSYASVVALSAIKHSRLDLGWNLYGLVARIEIERHRTSNPQVPDWLVADYAAAIQSLATLALTDLRACQDPLLARSALALVALARGLPKWGAVLLDLDESEVDELVAERHPGLDSQADGGAG